MLLMLKVIAMAEVWFLALLGTFCCIGAGVVLICAVMVNGFIHSANDGVEGREEKHDELHG